MEPSLLHPLLTTCAIECTTLISNASICESNEALVHQLARCSTRCVEAAQGCQLGTCLPETLKRCRDECLQTASRLEQLDAGPARLQASLQAVRDCASACDEK